MKKITYENFLGIVKQGDVIAYAETDASGKPVNGYIATAQVKPKTIEVNGIDMVSLLTLYDWVVLLDNV